MPSRPSQATPVAPVLDDVRRLRDALASVRTRQLRSVDQRAHLKALALAWFQTYRPTVVAATAADLVNVDAAFQQLLTLAEKFPSAVKVRNLAKGLQADLVRLQTSLISSPVAPPATDSPPSFASVPDPLMQQVLARRWQECVACLAAGAPLAATVMMGGLLESLFLARVNREPNKQVVFTAVAAPKDPKTGQTLSLKDWGLKDYIAVAHELRWIPQSVRDVSQIVRDYRNYIHPQKELSHQIALTIADAQMFWHVSKAISAHLL